MPNSTKDFQEALQKPPCTSKPINSGRRKLDVIIITNKRPVDLVCVQKINVDG
jgi:hypothetical protein